MVDGKQHGKGGGRGLTKSLIKFDKMLEVGLAMPAAVFVGWLIGVGLDEWLGEHWIYLAGIGVGVGAGFMQIFRLLHDLEAEAGKDSGKGGKGAGDAGDDRIDQEPK